MKILVTGGYAIDPTKMREELSWQPETKFADVDSFIPCPNICAVYFQKYLRHEMR